MKNLVVRRDSWRRFFEEGLEWRRLRISFLSMPLIAASCGHQSTEPEQIYQLSGKIIALNAQDQTATVDAAAVPKWMEAMTMEYPVKSRSDFSTLQVGEKIRATISVRGPGEYTLTDIHEDKSGK